MIVQSEYIEGNGFIAEVIRTSRIKTANVRVEEGAVSVVVPMELPQSRIVTILKDKNQWIKHKIVLHREAMPVSAKDYVSGESFSYLGRNYRLKVSRGHFKPVKLVQGRLVVTVPQGINQSNMVRNALVRWYKCHAGLKLRDKVARYAGIIGVEPAGVGIRTFKSRWGSCSNKGQVDFNWKIIMAPNRIVDYVVVHELCHLKQHDHSHSFGRWWNG
ncbi:MAG: M48 family metallopeptidase [Endozoicomonadaceae bacterium]|nr:M48 family metallopeptidase [Endozoicomonadaceae bacterium]